MQYPKKDNMEFPQSHESSPHLYYSRLAGHFYQRKLEMLFDYLPSGYHSKAMEIGYGSGIALKELSGRFQRVVALDVHDKEATVQKMLMKEKISNAHLFHHNIFETPFIQEKDFDVVLSSSVFEHIPPAMIPQGIKNVFDVLKEGGCFLLGFPLKDSLAMNIFFKGYEKIYKKFKKDVYSFSLEDDHPSGEDEILPCVQEFFAIENQKYYFNRFMKLYITLKCKKVSK